MLQVSVRAEPPRNPWEIEQFCLLLSDIKIGECYIGTSGELCNLLIKREFRGYGLGQYFVQEIMKRRKFFLRCFDNRVAFYKRCGLIELDNSKVPYNKFAN